MDRSGWLGSEREKMMRHVADLSEDENHVSAR